MDNNYVIYHLHSDLSSCITSIDSVTKPKQYVERAKECGVKAMAFSEHGSVMMWLKKKEMIEAAGMKYIHAEEFYLTETLDEKIKDNMHCVLIAKNYDGVLELNELSSRSFNRNDNHFYYMPRISLEELENTSDNIMITSACLASPLVKGSINAKKRFLAFLIKNKDRCYLEIQHHKEKRQCEYNNYLYRLHKKYGIPLITGTDTHALNQEHMEARAILQKAKNIHFADEDAWDLSFKTYDELVTAYKEQGSLPMEVVLEAIDNTNKMADRVEPFEMDRSYKYPHLWEDSEKLFIKKIKAGLKARGVDKFPNRDEYADRIKYEMKAYKHNQAIDFMLLMEDIVAWCRTQDIQIGYGRGSCNGSIIAWLLGITEMDSIKHKLNFDRFMNVERVSLSDIDTDFPPSRIEDVKNYIFNRHGLYCSDIATFNTVADKGAIRDVCRALYKKDYDELPKNVKDMADIESEAYGSLSYTTSKEVNDFINGDYLGISEWLCSMVDSEDGYKQAREKYPEVFKYVDIIKGVVVSCGNHPCGVITAPHTIDDRLGLFTTTTDNYPISQLYMKEVDSLNYVKLDCLKLDTIELISNTCKAAGIEMLTPDNVDVNDLDVWNSMREDTTAIFQWEGDVGNSYIKRLMSDENIEKFTELDPNFDRMTLLSIGNSAIRPAGASYREDLARGIVRKSGSEAIDDFLKPTFGYLVFQCQIIEFLHQYCGFTMGEADLVRRGFAKKSGTEQYIPIIKNGGYLSEDKKHFICGFIDCMNKKYKMTNKEADETIVAFIRVIEDASSYLFSLNHSQPYSYEGYVCAYLRYHYPLEFLTCSFNINKDNADKTMALTNYARKNNVKIEQPKFRYSKGDYAFSRENNAIYKGMSSIKNITDSGADELYVLRDNTYDSFIELLVDIKDTKVNSRQLDILIKLDFFSEFGEINELLQQRDVFDELYGKKQIKFEKWQYDPNILRECAGKCTEKMAKDFDSITLIRRVIASLEPPETTPFDKIKYEKEFLGYISTTIPDIMDDCYYVTETTGYNNKTLVLYNLKTGETLTIKNRTKKQKAPKEDDIIRITEMENTKKYKPLGKDENGKMQFERIDEYETVLTGFSFVNVGGKNG